MLLWLIKNNTWINIIVTKEKKRKEKMDRWSMVRTDRRPVSVWTSSVFLSREDEHDCCGWKG